MAVRENLDKFEPGLFTPSLAPLPLSLYLLYLYLFTARFTAVNIPVQENSLVISQIIIYISRTGINGCMFMISNNALPYGNIVSPKTIGQIVRDRRKSQGATQAEFASLCGVGVRFISDLENGKPTVELGKALRVLTCLGLELSIQPRGWQKHIMKNSEQK